jgi:hypothetical protein
MTRPSKPASKKAPRKKAHKEPAVHHSSAHHPPDHHAHSHDHPERRVHPRGDDIFTKIQDATEKVLRERKHELKK